jgi:hypothetical protein
MDLLLKKTILTKVLLFNYAIGYPFWPSIVRRISVLMSLFSTSTSHVCGIFIVNVIFGRPKHIKFKLKEDKRFDSWNRYNLGPFAFHSPALFTRTAAYKFMIHI